MTPEEPCRLPCVAYAGNEPFIFVSYAHEDKARVYPELERLHGWVIASGTMKASDPAATGPRSSQRI